ncbi:Integrator complex subunit 9 [Entomortierella beljakovae]|nr:Integrator complex subunit 9 [Entomortierella beljakovae]
MAPRKQEMVYLPEAPLLHGILLEKGPAKNYKSVHGAFSADLKYPCIVFGGHPSLRSGPMACTTGACFHTLTRTTEPRIDVPASLEPFEDLEITRIPTQATASIQADGTVELADTHKTVSTSTTQWSCYKLAKGIFPQSFGRTSLAPVAGSLSIYNNQMQLEPASVAGRQILALYTQRQLRGTMNLQSLLTGLFKIGVVDPDITESDGKSGEDTSGGPEIKVEFELEGQPASIIIREGETIVKCEESSRPLLREPILRCFQSL